MSRQFADDRSRPTEDAQPDDLPQQLLKQVLSATAEAQRASHPHRAKYQSVIDRWRGSPWHIDTIGVSLVRASLTDWLANVKLPQNAQEALINDIAKALFEDPSASVKLEAWWRELQESKG